MRQFIRILFILFSGYGCNNNSHPSNRTETIPTPRASVNKYTVSVNDAKALSDDLKNLSEIDKSLKLKALKITTDKTFQNFISFELENTSDKKITNIEVQEGENSNNLEINLSPGKKKVFKIETELEMIPNNLKIQKIRFEDGSFETRMSSFEKVLQTQQK